MNKEYYKKTLEGKEIDPNKVLSLGEYIQKYSKINPKIAELFAGFSQFTAKGNCYGNVLFWSSGVLRGEWDYVEGVLEHLYNDGVNDRYVHHAWAYSRSLDCYVETCPIDPLDRAYFISDVIKSEDVDKLITEIVDEEDDTNVSYQPNWLNKDVPLSLNKVA